MIKKEETTIKVFQPEGHSGWIVEVNGFKIYVTKQERPSINDLATGFIPTTESMAIAFAVGEYKRHH